MKVVFSSLLIAIFFLCYYFYNINTYVPSNAEPESELVFKNCHLYDFDRINIKCGEYVFSAVDDELVKVSFAIIEPALTTSVDQYNGDIPVVYLDGGPGWGDAFSFDNMVFWQDFYIHSNVNRPLILFNPVGTKGSSHNKQCDKWKELHALHLKSTSKEFLLVNEKKENEALKNCLDLVSNKRFFSSKYQYKVLSKLLLSLNYTQWHLWGSSYGTRLALVGGAVDNRVVSLVLDSPYLFGQGFVASNIELDINAFLLHDKQFNEKIRVDKNISFPEFFLAALSVLDANHVFVDLPDRLNKPTFILDDFKLLITSKRLYELAFFSLYSTENTAIFYEILSALVKVDSINESIYLNNNKLIEQFVNANTHNNFNALTYTLTECMDNGISSYKEIKNNFIKTKNIMLSNVNPLYEKQFDMIISRMFNVYQADLKNNICSKDKKYASYKVNTLRYPNKPMFFLAGEYDPVTPASALKQLPKRDNIYKYIAAGAGHGVLFGGFCNSNVLGAFFSRLDSMSEIELKQRCLVELK